MMSLFKNILSTKFRWIIVILFFIQECKMQSIPKGAGYLILDYLEDETSGGIYLYICSNSDSMGIAKTLFNNTNRFSLTKKITILTKNEKLGYMPITLVDPINRISVFVDLTCESGMEFLIKSSEYDLFNDSYTWMVWSDNYDNSIIFLNVLNISIFSNFTLVMDNYEIYDIYKVHRTTDVISTLLGKWNDEDSKLEFDSFRPSRTNFHGLEMNVTIVFSNVEFNMSNLLEPLLNRFTAPENDLNILNKFSTEVTLLLTEVHNMSYRYFPTNIWGTIQPPFSGKWSGSFGMLQRGEVDLCLAPFRLRIDRYNSSTFIFPFVSFRLCFTFLQPPIFGSLNALATPFTNEVWLCCLGLIILTFVGYIIIFIDEKEPAHESFGTALISTIGAVAQQGIEDSSVRPSSRIVSFSSLVFTYVASLYYSASVLNGLLSPTPNSIQTIGQLMDSNTRIGLLDISYNKEARSKESVIFSFDEITDKLLLKLTNTKMYYSLNEGAQLIKKGKFAFYSEDILLYKPLMKILSDAEMCSLYKINKIPPTVLSLAARDNSPYREIFTRTLNLARERGIIYRIREYYYPPKPTCQWQQEALSIGVESLTIAYLAYVAGFTLSIIIFLLENFHTKRCKKSKVISTDRFKFLH